MDVNNVKGISDKKYQNNISPAIRQTARSFAGVLSQTLKISKHASQRLKLQNITLDEKTLERLEGALNKAEQKGLKNDVLILDGDRAYIVNIKNRVVVTVKDVSGLKENIFTNIDGVLML